MTRVFRPLFFSFFLVFLSGVQMLKANFSFAAFETRYRDSDAIQMMVNEVMSHLEVKRRGIVHRTPMTDFVLPGGDRIAPGCFEASDMSQLRRFLLTKLEGNRDEKIRAHNVALSFYEWVALFNGYVEQLQDAYYQRELVKSLSPSFTIQSQFSAFHPWFYDYSDDEIYIKRDFAGELLKEDDISKGRLLGSLIAFRQQLAIAHQRGVHLLALFDSLKQAITGRYGSTDEGANEEVSVKARVWVKEQRLKRKQRADVERMSQASSSSLQSISDLADQTGVTFDEIALLLKKLEEDRHQNVITNDVYHDVKMRLTRAQEKLKHVQVTSIVADLMQLAVETAQKQGDAALGTQVQAVAEHLENTTRDHVQAAEAAITAGKKQTQMQVQRQQAYEMLQAVERLDEEEGYGHEQLSRSEEVQRFVLAALHQNPDYDEVCAEIHEHGYGAVYRDVMVQGAKKFGWGVLLSSGIGIGGAMYAPLATTASVFFALQALVDVAHNPQKYAQLLRDIGDFRTQTAYGKSLSVARGIATLGMLWAQSQATSSIVDFAHGQIETYRQQQAVNEGLQHAEHAQEEALALKEQRRQQTRLEKEQFKAERQAVREGKAIAQQAQQEATQLKEQRRTEVHAMKAQHKEALRQQQAQMQQQTLAQRAAQAAEEAAKTKKEWNWNFDFNEAAATVAGTSVAALKYGGLVSLGTVSFPVTATSTAIIAGAALGRFVATLGEQEVASVSVPTIIRGGFKVKDILGQ